MEPQLRRPERSDRRLLWHPRRHAPLQSAKRVRTCGLHASRSDRGAQGTHRRRRACAQSQRRVRRRDDPIRRRGTIGRREKQRCPSPPDEDLATQGFACDRCVDRTAGDFTGGRLYGDVLWRPSGPVRGRPAFKARGSISRRSAEQSWRGRASASHSRPSRANGCERRIAAMPSCRCLSRCRPSPRSASFPNVLPISLGGRVETAACAGTRNGRRASSRRSNTSTRTCATSTFRRRRDRGPRGRKGEDRTRRRDRESVARQWRRDVRNARGDRVRDPPGAGLGEAVPLVPGRFARAGFTFVHESRLRLTSPNPMSATGRGMRAGSR